MDDEKRELVLQAAGYGELTQADIGLLRYPLQDSDGAIGLTAWIYLHKQRVVADSYDELKAKPGYLGKFDPQLHGWRGSRGEKHPCQQFYGGPISLGEERFGVLNVENKKIPNADGTLRFSEADQAALDTVAAILALALKQAMASREREKQLESTTRSPFTRFATSLRRLRQLCSTCGGRCRASRMPGVWTHFDCKRPCLSSCEATMGCAST